MIKVYNPEGGRFDVENEFLANIPNGMSRPPLGKPWEYILLGRYKSNHHRVLITLRGSSKKEVDELFMRLVDGAEII